MKKQIGRGRQIKYLKGRALKVSNTGRLSSLKCYMKEIVGCKTDKRSGVVDGDINPLNVTFITLLLFLVINDDP